MAATRVAVEDWLSLWSLPKPIIAQVHGYCLGLANELVGCCDLVVCGTSSRFGFPEMRQVALFPTLGFWPDRIGIQRTKELAFTGRLVEGPEAVALGLAMECVPDETLEARVDELAASIAEVDADRLSVVKAAIKGGRRIGGSEQPRSAVPTSTRLPPEQRPDRKRGRLIASPTRRAAP